MNQLLQAEGKINFGVGRTSRKYRKSDSVSSNSPRLERASADGLKFAAKIKAKFDGSRPVVEDRIFATVEQADLKIGREWLKIEHFCQQEDRGKPYYSTKITNRSTQRVRIDRFGTFVKTGKTLVLHTITGGFFSRQQFQEWYDLGESQWLEPGQTVTDPNNHSKRGVYWAYFGTTANGKEFVAGAAWNGRRWWMGG
ncbi:hypothetical protein [Chamaesiphon polymorphus]|uniref:hypothetical protein n=1 Tax=Chamaesiphon polymorphus TaxID=2107691 RepID=UPI0011B21959|nr:hypothetical protein [Chamaesiphon polymorphus]